MELPENIIDYRVHCVIEVGLCAFLFTRERGVSEKPLFRLQRHIQREREHIIRVAEIFPLGWRGLVVWSLPSIN